MKTRAQVVIIGGGVTGCSIAYHLATSGWTDVVLLERSELTAGSTWHAAGGTGAFGGGGNATLLHKYSFDIYPKLETETGQSCGFHHVGALTLARTEERVEELKRHHALARRFGLETQWLSPREVKERAPIMDVDSIKAVLYEADYGHVDPNGVTNAFAIGARNHGVDIHRHTPVIGLTQSADSSWDVKTDRGSINAEHVVNAAGLWGREVGRLAGIELPLMPVEHHYFVTEEIPEIAALDFELPLVGDADAEYYMRQEGQGLLLGVYEDECTHWAIDGTPLDFGHELLPNALERIERNLQQACEAVPVLGEAGIKKVINGPMIFSPDLNPLIGPHPRLRNFWCSNGVMTGFSQSAAIGMVMAEWMSVGVPPLDMFMWDVARFGDWTDSRYVKATTGNRYSTRFATLYPYEERDVGRPVRTTPAYDEYKARNACFGCSDGTEYPLWFAPRDQSSVETLTFHRPNWFEPVREECLALHRNVGIIDISTYGKHLVTGPGARAWLQLVMAAEVPMEDGRIALSPMLNHSGHLMGEFSIGRLAEDEYLLISSGIADRFHHRWWGQLPITDNVEIRSMTNEFCAFAVAGPRSRELLSRLTDADLTAEGWLYGRIRRARIGITEDAIIARMSYTGELGYEIYTRPADQLAVLHQLLESGHDYGVRLVGIRALNSLRIEKGYGAWGPEYGPDYNVFEAGMERMVRLEKKNFIGRDAVINQQGNEKRYRYSLFQIDVDTTEPWGGEPVFEGEKVVGYLTSASYGHRVSASLALGYLYPEKVNLENELTTDILGERRRVEVLQAAAFDPDGLRMRS